MTTQHASKARFLDVALQVIRTKGYEATTVDDLCAAAKLTKGSFFHHFDGKEDLAIAAAEHFYAMADRLFSSAPYQKIADPLDRLLAYIDFRIAILQGELPQYTCLLGTMVQEVYETHPAIRDACNRYISAHADWVAGIIEEARRLYAPNAPWTAQSLGLFTQAAIQGSFILAKAKDGPQVAVECVRHLRRYLETQFTRNRV